MPKYPPMKQLGTPGVEDVPTRVTEDFMSTHVAQYDSTKNFYRERPRLDAKQNSKVNYDHFAGAPIRDNENAGKIVRAAPEFRWRENTERQLLGGRFLDFGSEPGSVEAEAPVADVDDFAPESAPTCPVSGDFASIEDGDDSEMSVEDAVAQSLVESGALIKIAKSAPNLPLDQVMAAVVAHESGALTPVMQPGQTAPKKLQAGDYAMLLIAAWIAKGLLD